MNVEFVGGPKDGEKVAVPDECREVSVVIPKADMRDYVEGDDKAATVSFGVVSIPIELDRYHHKWIVRWPKAKA